MTWELLVFIGCCCAVYIYFKYFTMAGVVHDLMTKPRLRKMYAEILDKGLSKKLSSKKRREYKETKKWLEDLEGVVKGEAVESRIEIERLIALGKTKQD